MARWATVDGRWTVDDWEQLPEDGRRYELIDGVLYVTTSPSLFHQSVVMKLYDLAGYPARNQFGMHVFLAPVGLLLPGMDAFQPDFVIVRAENAAILKDRRIRGVPDLIAEVLSPGNASLDLIEKNDKYRSAGVPEYITINPSTRTVIHRRLTDPNTYGETTYTEADSLALDCLPNIRFRVGELFEGAPDTTL
jgi:Uma2 family endonuclease